MEGGDGSLFAVVDWVVFGGMLAVSSAIGVYFAFFAKQKQNTTEEYLMGGKSMGVVPIALSLIAGHISGISMLGLPSEMYTYGTQLWIGVLAEALSFIVAGVFFVPVLYNLNITSSYEYLERRYSVSLRKLGSGLYLLGTLLYIPIVMYAPALGLSQVTGISVHVIVPVTCVVCIFYTTLGGVKAVVWTDTVQTALILTGVLTVAVLGTNSAGGFTSVWQANERMDRIDFFNMNPDPTIRHTFWSVIIGRFFTNLSICAVNQSMVQRYLAMPTLFRARLTILLLAVGWVVLISFCCYTGLVIFAAFADCDPISAGIVAKSDQILPYFVSRVATRLPSLSGIFMAGVFSAALSSMSSCLNSMTGVLFEDFLRPHLAKPVSEAKASFIMKLIAVVIGVISVLLATLVDKLGGIIQTTYSLGSISHGTIFSIYVAGMFLPWVTSGGAIAGGIASTAVVSWLSFGTQYAIGSKQITFPTKPFSTAGCNGTRAQNATAVILTYFADNSSSITLAATDIQEPVATAFPLYRLSYVYYTVVSVVVCLSVALLVSFLTGPNDPATMDHKLLCPHIRWMFKQEQKKPEIVLTATDGRAKDGPPPEKERF